MDEDDDDFFDDAIFAQLDAIVQEHEEKKQIASSQVPEETSSPQVPAGNSPAEPFHGHAQASASASYKPSAFSAFRPGNGQQPWRAAQAPPQPQQSGIPLGKISQAAGRARATAAAQQQSGGWYGRQQPQPQGQQGPPSAPSELERRLAQEEGTNALLRQKLEAAEHAKFELQRALNMQSQTSAAGHGQPHAAEELQSQLRALQQQLQHKQAEAEQVKREGRERDLRLQEALGAAQARDEELEKLRRLKDSLEEELQNANIERRARAAEASTALSLTQGTSEGSSKRRSLTLSSNKRQRRSDGGAEGGDPLAPPLGAANEPPMAPAPTPPPAPSEPSNDAAQASKARTGASEWCLPAPPITSASSCASFVQALMVDCGRELNRLVASDCHGEVSSQPLEPLSAREQLDSEVATAVQRNVQDLSCGAAQPPELCRTLVEFVIRRAELPKEAEPRVANWPDTPSGRVWKLRAPRPPDHTPLHSALCVLAALLRLDNACASLLLKECGLCLRKPLRRERNLAVEGRWSLPSRAKVVPQGSALVPAAPEEPEANPGTGEDAAGSTQPMEEDDEGGGAGGRPQRLLTALLETVSRLKEARLGGARAALEAAVRLLSALTEEAIAEAPQAAATTAFGSLMAPGTDASLLPLLHVGLQDTNGGKTAAVRSPGALRASVLRLLVGQAAGSEEMLRAWGLTQEEAEADDKAEAEQGEAGADDQGPREDGPASLADLLLDNLRAPTLEELQDQEGWKVSLEKGRGGEAEPKGPEAVWERQQRDDMLARRLQAFLTIGPEADDLTEKCGGFYGSMEAPRSVLAAVAALLENRQWPALKGLLSRGLGHHLVASLDELTREAGVGKVMESVFPPLGLLGLGPGPGRPGSPPEPSDPPSPAVPASLLIEQLRLVHEALLLMATLADERHLGWILLDDLVGSPSTLRTCVTMTSRLEDAAETSEWRQFRGGENGEAPLLCRHGLPLASWAVALQRRRWQQQEQKNPKQKKEASTQGGNAANAAGEGGIMHRCWSGPGGCRGCSSAAQVIGLAREVNARVLEAYEQQRNASAAMSQP